MAVYKETASFPASEGQGRLTKGEFAQFLGHARGSVNELETQLEIAAELGLITTERASEITKQGGEVARILNGLIDSIETKSKKAGAGR